jgi:hypothetical protein
MVTLPDVASTMRGLDPMSESEKTRKIVVLATGAAVALSATAIVLLQQHGVSNERNSIQSALRDGASNTKGSGKVSEWFRLACTGRCND